MDNAVAFDSDQLGLSQTFRARLRAAGARIVIEPNDHVAGHRRGHVTDPDGNWLALVDAHSVRSNSHITR